MISNQKRLFKKEYAFELFHIAQGDFDSAAELSAAKSGRKENVIYLVQQSVEKSLKALLVHQQIPFPLVHDLGIILGLLPDSLIPPNGFKLVDLNPYASVRRYEEGSLKLTESEIQSALQAGKEVLKWVEQHIGKN